MSSQIRNAHSGPKYDTFKNGPLIDQEQKVQLERPMNSNPKPKPTSTPKMVTNRQHQPDLPPKPRSKTPNIGQKGPSPRSQKGQRPMPIPVSQPYVYQAPSAAPRQAPPAPLIPSPVMKTAIPKPRSKPTPPQPMPADNEDDDAPLDLVMYSKKKPNPNPPKESKPLAPNPQTPTKEQNKPLNLKRISGGAVFATVNLKGPKKGQMRTNNEPRGQMQVRSPTKSPIKSNQPNSGFPVHRNTNHPVMTGRDAGQYQARPRVQNGPGPSGQGKVNGQVVRNPQNPPPIPPRKPTSRPKPRVSHSEEVFKNYPQQTPPQQSSNVVLKQSNSPIEQSSHNHHGRPGPSNSDRSQPPQIGSTQPGPSHSGQPKAEVKMSKSPQKRQDGKVNTPLKPLQMEGRKIFTSCTIKTPGSRKPNPKTPPVQRHQGQPNPNPGQVFRQSSPPDYKPEESELNGPMGQQSLESRLNKEYGPSRKRSSPSGQPGPARQSPHSPVKNYPPKYEPNDEQDLSPTTPNYAPRTVRMVK